jgi:hypothetical protein
VALWTAIFASSSSRPTSSEVTKVLPTTTHANKSKKGEGRRGVYEIACNEAPFRGLLTSLGVKRINKMPPTQAIGCTMDAGQEAKS